MTLLQKQQIFSGLVARFLSFINSQGYEVTLGEAWRPPEMAEIYAKEGKGTADSVHCLRLAIDVNLFKDTEYLTNDTDYKPFGDYWKSLSTSDYECCWGGDFTIMDGNHFSIMEGGVR